MPGGRHKSVVRDYVEKQSTDQQGRTIWKCSIGQCDATRKTKEFTSTKWAEHVLKECQIATKEIKMRVAQNYKSKASGTVQNEQSMTSNSSKRSYCVIEKEFSCEEGRQRKQCRINEYADHCSESRAKDIIEKITAFLVGCAIPFSIVNSSFFLNMIKSLNSAALRFIPHSKSFVNTHLPYLFKDTAEKISQLWKCSESTYKLRTIGFDAFTNEMGESIVNITETSNGMSSFLDCIDPKEHREDSEFYATVIDKQLKKASVHSKLPVEELFCGIVADNVSCNRAAFRILEQKYTTLFFVGCIAHSFDLMIEDVCKVPKVAELLKLCQSSVKFVKTH